MAWRTGRREATTKIKGKGREARHSTNVDEKARGFGGTVAQLYTRRRAAIHAHTKTPRRALHSRTGSRIRQAAARVSPLLPCPFLVHATSLPTSTETGPEQDGFSHQRWPTRSTQEAECDLGARPTSSWKRARTREATQERSIGYAAPVLVSRLKPPPRQVTFGRTDPSLRKQTT
eukprot:9503045-Pyramimonas_sp.AAC.1